ncbi:hypothetical protein K469DRAFT_748803 [Zopfia rhizophila CBS 207.26]|uniref:Uncharacterized protein n=1 Tax=Zopfia rhizophila CBS 207.26 TaxID=1314779 RepID=A0A6A6ED37_9PEZI|nr:hypothetical protein K469DRAFT_748803 [Zopfia rhizophila CBS 207.26]
MLTYRKLPERLYERYRRSDGGKSPPTKKARGQTTLLKEEYRISDRDATVCNKLLADVIYSSRVPFNFVENPAFKRFLKRIRLACDPPSRYRIAGPLLTEAYKEIKEKMEKALEKSPE